MREVTERRLSLETNRIKNENNLTRVDLKYSLRHDGSHVFQLLFRCSFIIPLGSFFFDRTALKSEHTRSTSCKKKKLRLCSWVTKHVSCFLYYFSSIIAYEQVLIISAVGRFATSQGEVCRGSGTYARLHQTLSPASVAQGLILSRRRRNTRAEALMVRPCSTSPLSQ